ncbi:MAG: ion channel [Jiangellaceae bacterium]
MVGLILRSLGMLAGITLMYAALPLDVAQRSTLVGLLGGIGLVLGGLAGFLVLLRLQIRSAAGETPVLAVAQRLLTTLYLLVFFFAAVYYGLSLTSGHLNGVATKIDALYFSATIVTTVGFGDITAVGQVARVIVTTHMIFDLVYIGVAIRMLSRLVERRP